MSKLSETKQKNEKVKRRYFDYKRGPDGFSDTSILAVEKAIWKYEEFSEQEDFGLFNNKKADQFKKYLATKLNKKSGKLLGLKSQYHHLRHLREYFLWLSTQPGYKSRIEVNDAMYLQLSKKERQMATAPSEPKYPTLAQIQKMCSFPINNEIDQRDRALIAFTAITGIRDQAVVTLRIGCYDPETRIVKQLPSMGVETKFSKEIYTTLLSIDVDLYRYFSEWYEFVTKEKHFGLEDPLFPSTEIAQVGPKHHAYESKGVSKKFWADAGPMRQIFRDRAKEVGVDYFYPHSFRHFVTVEAEKHITTAEQMKALSQNLGHEHIATTYMAYGSMSHRRVNEVVKSIDFSEKKTPDRNDQIKLVETLLEQLKKS
jgi:integrase